MSASSVTLLDRHPEPTAAKSKLLNVNTASSDQLQALPGIGPKKADAIVSYRSANGPFQQVDDLVQVKGIGPKTLDKLRPLVTVGKVKKAKSHADVRAPGSG
ncbi:MAG: topoisomerase [Deltaproteobacteria bacterium]|nr:topoisomerase [Deltaproteobacteria bacterium]